MKIWINIIKIIKPLEDLGATTSLISKTTKKTKKRIRGFFWYIIRNFRSVGVRNMLTNREIIRAGKRVMRVERRFKRTVINTDHMVKMFSSVESFKHYPYY